mgnify:FL=1
MAVLSEIDTSPDALEQEMVTRTTPISKESLALPDEAAQPVVEEVGQMKQHVLTSFMGELHDDLRR